MVLWKNSDADDNRQHPSGEGVDDCGVSGGVNYD
jgi:hypothetical protein